MSRLIERLDSQIAQAEQVFERECLKSRRAAILARQGQLSEARFALAGLRSQSHRLRHPVLSAWVALVDGLIDHCETLSPVARDKFRRAHELAAGTEDAALRAECAAWLSAADMNANDVEATAIHAAEAVRLAPADCHSARARASLVLGSAWFFAGDDAQAQRWHQRGRMAATAEGDMSLVSIMLHNKAVFSANRISLDDALGRADLAAAQRVLMEAESTGNYDSGVGNEQLSAEMPLVRAQLMTVLGRHAEAVALIDAQLARARIEGHAHREARFQVDALHGEVRLGRLDEAVRRLRVIQAALPTMTEPDDLAVVHARLAAALPALGREEQAQGHRLETDAAMTRYLAEQQRWVRALASVESA